ncbi:MAG: bacteriohemerythrin [Tenuifilaceae bacterium]
MENRSKKAYSETILNTNITVIDDGHRKLLEIQNNIKSLVKQNVTKNDLTQVFFALSNFFENHLLKEELYLKSKGYPNIDNHKSSHLDFIKEIELLKDSYQNDIQTTLKELDDFIRSWLHNHSINYNKEVIEFLNTKG